MDKDLVLGAPCTICIGSDKYAGHIHCAFGTSRIVVIKHNNNERYVFTKRKDGIYREVGRNPVKYLILGLAINYGDPNF
jgi:hypothetical protein